MGGDVWFDRWWAQEDVISIHTSVWEVTGQTAEHCNKYLNFNPHLRMGGDYKDWIKSLMMTGFQSTPPYGR